MRNKLKKLMLGLVVLALGFMSGALQSETAVADDYEVTSYVGKKVYVTATKDTYVQTRAETVNYDFVVTYVKVPKGTRIGYVLYDYDVCHNDNRQKVVYEKLTYNMYEDGLFLDMTIVPISKLTLKEYKKSASSTTYTATGNSQIFYPASELLTVEMGIPTLDSNAYPTASNPYLMAGGGYIKQWTPKTTISGSDGYNVSLGIPFSLSTTVEVNTDYCEVKDKTNKEKGLFSVQYDYKKYASGNIFHYCSPTRRKVIFGTSYAAASCSWYTTDNSYKVYPYIKMKFSLSDSKTYPNSYATFEKNISVYYYMK